MNAMFCGCDYPHLCVRHEAERDILIKVRAEMMYSARNEGPDCVLFSWCDRLQYLINQLNGVSETTAKRV